MQIDDKVWFDSKRKVAGICNDIVSLKAGLKNVLLLAHFPASISILSTALRTAQLEFHTFTQFDSSMLCQANASGTIALGLVRALQPPNALMRGQATTAVLEIIVAEHHPKSGHDQRVIDIAESLPCRPSVCFHTALDDPLMKHFGSDSVVSLFKRLGMDESEHISHPLVTSAIRNAQEKIEKQVPRDTHTESMDEWFRFNLRE